MKRNKYILLIFKLLGLSFVSLYLLAWGRGTRPETVTVFGTVLDPGSLTPLPGTVVSWKSQKARTDDFGHYEIKVPQGVRQISFASATGAIARKMVILRQAGDSVRVDVLLPRSSATPAAAILALDRGSLITQDGRDLSSDITADSDISLADQNGNSDQLLTLNTARYRVHSPVWLSRSSLAFAKEGVVGNPKNNRQLGVFEYQSNSAQVRQIASGIGARFLSRSPRSDALAIATYRELFILDSVAHPTPPRRIFSLPRNGGFVLSVAWAADDRIYFTVDDSVPLDDRHSLTRSRIASVRPDGADLDSGWAADPEYSFRYPENADGGEIIFCRFTLDGGDQKLWSRSLRTGIAKPLAAAALHAVYLDVTTDRLYYIYRHDLHLRYLKSGADWVMANSVEQADYLR